MRYTSLALGALVLLGGLGACGASAIFSDRDIEGSGTIVTETRPVGGVDAIRLAGEGTVIVTVGQGPSLTIETDDNLLKHIETPVRNRLLEIRTQRGVNLEPTDAIIYRVAMKDMPKLIVTGTGSFQVNE